MVQQTRIQQVIDYLQKNKNEYGKESLIIELKKVGYTEDEIQYGVDVAYNGASMDLGTTQNNSAVENANKKSRKQKRIDIFIGIILGFVLPFVYLTIVAGMDSLNMTPGTVFGLFNVLVVVLFILACVYLVRKGREFIILGILIDMLLVPLLLFGACIVMLSGGW